jgi:hypothetical protein
VLEHDVKREVFISQTNGMYYADESKSLIDIISEWIDKPIVDWSLMPAWAKFVAMDKKGKWWWYTHKPSLEHAWCIIEGFVGKIPSEYTPKWEGDWRNSLIERP